MDDAKQIVDGIFREIEQRVHAEADNENTLKPLRDEHRAIEIRVSRDFSSENSDKYLHKIRKVLGDQFVLSLEQTRINPFSWKNRDNITTIYKNAATLIEHCLFYQKQAEDGLQKNRRLLNIQKELIESQTAHVQEVEILDSKLSQEKFFTEIVLLPFEQAIKKIIAYLKVKKLEVFLFDDDKFLASELKSDGQTFIYHPAESDRYIPKAVSILTMQDIHEAVLDVPLFVDSNHIGHYRVVRQYTEGFNKRSWSNKIKQITPVLAHILEANKNRLLARKVYIDDLTGLYNKRKLNEQMGKLFNQFKLGKKELYIAMMDIDNFKILNDTHGHPVGDEILKHTASIIKQEVPYAYRYGGEEFAAVFYGYTREQTTRMLEQLRETIAACPFDISHTRYHITLSIGFAAFETNMNSVMDAIERADNALFISKEDGKNRCSYYTDVKDRIAADNSRLRQEVLRLKEELKKTSAGNKKGVSNRKPPV